MSKPDASTRNPRCLIIARLAIACAAVVGLVLGSACAQRPEIEAEDAPATTATQSGAASQDDWARLDATALDTRRLAQHQRAVEAQRAMAGALMGELVAAIDSEGPPAAIAVCAEAAPRIAAEVAAAHQVRIGRTSHRLRNPANRPPVWAEPIVSEQTAGESPVEPVLLAGPGGELGLLTPIRLKPECEMCHGSPATMAEEVSVRLADHYPEDQATGFVAGDLRGWFWVEVPPEKDNGGT